MDEMARNDLSAEGRAWYARYLDALDAKDLDAYGGFLADDCEMFTNNEGPIRGKAAILAMLGPYWRSFGSLKHENLMILGDDRSFMLEALNHYRTLDGRAVTLRAVAITERDDRGLASSVRLYTDTGPLFSEAASSTGSGEAA